MMSNMEYEELYENYKELLEENKRLRLENESLRRQFGLSLQIPHPSTFGTPTGPWKTGGHGILLHQIETNLYERQALPGKLGQNMILIKYSWGKKQLTK